MLLPQTAIEPRVISRAFGKKEKKTGIDLFLIHKQEIQPDNKSLQLKFTELIWIS